MTPDLCYQMLNVMCPMNVIFGQDGRIVSAGPTIRKIVPVPLIGEKFLSVFAITNPRVIASVEALGEDVGVRLKIRLVEVPNRQLQGVAMEGPAPGQITVNLSFGISIVDAVREYELTASDFAPTDLTVEMLYLVEAKSAAMEASRQLNERLQHARVEAEKQALTDTLTGLSNRRAMDQALASAVQAEETFALMHVDLDFFKAVNDTLGHAAGDHVLLEVARVMKDVTREQDIVARVGGDEFVILLRNTSDYAVLERIAERLIQRVQKPIPFEENLCRISASVGTVVSNDYVAPSPDQLLGDADAALYAAKNAGRGRHVLFSPHLKDASQTA